MLSGNPNSLRGDLKSYPMTTHSMMPGVLIRKVISPSTVYSLCLVTRLRGRTYELKDLFANILLPNTTAHIQGSSVWSMPQSSGLVLL